MHAVATIGAALCTQESGCQCRVHASVTIEACAGEMVAAACEAAACAAALKCEGHTVWMDSLSHMGRGALV